MIFFSNNILYAQNEFEPPAQTLNVTKSKSHESFVVPFSASNTDRKNPVIHTFETSKDDSWILGIDNNMTYNKSSEAKTIIKLMENKPSEKFIELAMFEQNEKFWVAVNTNESGYIRVHERDTDGWSRDEPLMVGHANNQGLTITNGKRIVIDRLSLDGFNLGSIAIYGKDDTDSPINTLDGFISFDLIFGNPRDSPLYFLPIIMLVLVGGIVFYLLKIKKRDREKE
ncbi:MAG TPA: hypothetical protein VFU79_02710 [Nitrososphaeraceae archaeon]|nr:hypothetical protein [Nitrososphaeraceae archaeon]